MMQREIRHFVFHHQKLRRNEMISFLFEQKNGKNFDLRFRLFRRENLRRSMDKCRLNADEMETKMTDDIF